jgi:maleamate amidohydrolase
MTAQAHTPSLQEDYVRAGFGGKLPFGNKPALIVVDVVQAYVVPESPLYAPAFQDAVLPNQRLIEAMRLAGNPIIFTGVVYAPDGRDGGVFFQKVPALRCFVKDSPLAKFVQGVEPEDGDTLVFKQYASAFFGTSLASTLTAMGVDTVLITGYSTSGCVRATTLDAMQHGFTPFVVREACADRDPAPHASNLFDLQAKYAEVIGIEDALALLQPSA